MRRLGAIGFHHLQSGARELFARIHARRFDTDGIGVLRFDARCFFAHGRRHAHFFRARLLVTRRGSRLGDRFALCVRLGLLHLSLALHLQAVFLELLRVEGLFRALLARLLVRAILATIRTIAPVGTAAATAAAIAPAARFAALLFRLAVAIRRAANRSLRPLLLRRTRRTLVGAALTLRLLGRRNRALRKLGLRLDLCLRNIRLRALLPAVLRTVLALLLLLLRRALIAPLLVAPTVAAAIAAVLALASPVAVCALLAVASRAAITVTAATMTIVAVAVLVARPVRALRPCLPHR